MCTSQQLALAAPGTVAMRIVTRAFPRVSVAGFEGSCGVDGWLGRRSNLAKGTVDSAMTPEKLGWQSNATAGATILVAVASPPTAAIATTTTAATSRSSRCKRCCRTVFRLGVTLTVSAASMPKKIEPSSPPKAQAYLAMRRPVSPLHCSSIVEEEQRRGCQGEKRKGEKMREGEVRR